MARYHFNPETGNVGSCRAKPGNCPFTTAGSRHFDSREEARAAVETYFARPYKSEVARLFAVRSSIHREIHTRLVREPREVTRITLPPLADERRALDDRIEELSANAQDEELTPSTVTDEPAVKLVDKPLNIRSGDLLKGMASRLGKLSEDELVTVAEASELTDIWLSRLSDREAAAVFAYSQDPRVTADGHEALSSALAKAPKLEPLQVYSGLSKHVAADIRNQLATGTVELGYPISTSLNAAQVNGFMARYEEELTAVEIETEVGGSMIGVSHSPNELEFLLPAGRYEVLETERNVKARWGETDNGRDIDLFVRLRRLP